MRVEERRGDIGRAIIAAEAQVREPRIKVESCG